MKADDSPDTRAQQGLPVGETPQPAVDASVDAEVDMATGAEQHPQRGPEPRSSRVMAPDYYLG
ncbi:MAG: hypothetical protein ACJ72D_17720 [Marmoricola sp.]